MDNALRNFVTERAHCRCEFCTIHQDDDPVLRFQVDRVVPGQHGGEYTPENTALACHRCNQKKGPNLAGIDPQDGSMQPLFNPRRDDWSTHFAFEGPVVVGLTPIGRATIGTLGINDARQLKLRDALGYPHNLPNT
jgi:hypothetical protein